MQLEEEYNHTDFHHFDWCPLLGVIPEKYDDRIDKSIPQIIRIIDESRKIFINSADIKNISEFPEWKLKLTREIWLWLLTNYQFIFINREYAISTIEEETKYIIDSIRHLVIYDIKLITDAEILAIFTIFKVTDALDFYSAMLYYDDIDGTYIEHMPKYVHEVILLFAQAKKKTQKREEIRKDVENIESFPTPPGSTWKDVQISLIDNETIRVKIAEVEKQLHYSQMGLKDGRKKGCIPKNSWEELKKLIVLSGKLNNYPRSKQAEIEKNISSLRKALRTYFKIDGDPIPYLDTNKYKGYEAAFKTKDESSILRHAISAGKQCLNDDLLKNTHRLKNTEMVDKSQNRHMIKKECPKCKEPHNAVCLICKTETLECEECHNELLHNKIEYNKEVIKYEDEQNT